MLPKLASPSFSLTVPSTKTKIKFRPFSVKEEKILLIAKESGEAADILDSIRQVVTNCVLEEGFDVDKLTIYDLEYAFVKIRSVSVNNVAPVTLTDASDGKEYKIDVPLDQVEVKFPDVMPDSKIEVGPGVLITLKHPSATLYSNTEFRDGVEGFQKLVAKCIDKVWEGDRMFDPSKEKEADVIEFIDTFPVSAYDKIKEFFSATPRLEYVITYTNSKGEERKHTLSTLADFFSFV
jgi:hypothetical protein